HLRTATFCSPAWRINSQVRSALWSISFWWSPSVLMLGIDTKSARARCCAASLAFSHCKTLSIAMMLPRGGRAIPGSVREGVGLGQPSVSAHLGQLRQENEAADEGREDAGQQDGPGGDVETGPGAFLAGLVQPAEEGFEGAVEQLGHQHHPDAAEQDAPLQ